MRRQVVEIACSRCKRIEHRPVAPGAIDAQSTTLLAVLVDGDIERTIQFEELCGPCMKTVQTHFEAIGKLLEGVSPARGKVPDPIVSDVRELGGKKKGQGHP